MKKSDKQIKNFFYPKSVCVAGASTKEKSIGYELLRTMKSFGYKGRIFPVNPKAEEVLGYKCYKSVPDIKEKIDLGIVVVPKRFAEQTVDELISIGVKSIILITAGYKETGKEGKKAEQRISEIIKKNNVRLVGPNCMGVINTLPDVKLNATFVAEKPEVGKLGFLSQSGALGAAVLNSLRETNIRFAHFISVGNKADINENDILEYWLKDKKIKVLTFYLESFEDAETFLKIYSEQKTKKPVIVLKAGRTESGMKAASSHTGALSGNDKIVNALLRQFGIIRAKNLNELFNTAKGFEYFPLPKGNRIAVVTNAGGPAILAVDKLDEENLTLAKFSAETKKKLKKIVHPEGSINNPVDLLPGGTAEVYKKVNEVILQDKNVDAVISIFVEPVMVNAFEVIEAVNSIKKKVNKPLMQVCMPLPEFWKNYNENSVTRIPVFKQPEDPAEVISNMLLFQNKSKAKIKSSGKSIPSKFRFLSQTEVKKLCEKYSVPVIENKILSYDEIKKTKSFSFPLVVKGLNKFAIHKTELGIVKLNIKNRSELLKAIGQIRKSFAGKGLKAEGFLIQPFVKTKYELLIGGMRDNSFGPVIIFGSGGKYVEVLNDTQIRSAYLTMKDIDEMISQTKIGKIIKGVRGEESVDIIGLKKIIKSVAKMLAENENITEFDINPLIVDCSNKFHAVDVRIKTGD